jgi:hypothetical protein
LDASVKRLASEIWINQKKHAMFGVLLKEVEFNRYERFSTVVSKKAKLPMA